jgi:hypothetical protein
MQGFGDFGQVGGGVEAFGELAADAVEVGAEADVVDAGDFGDVVDVVDEHGERRAGDAVGVGALELVDFGIGELLCLRLWLWL